MGKKSNPGYNSRFLISKILMCLVAGMMSASTSLGQLSVNTVINPPYPTNLDYYIDDLSNLYLNIVNTDPATTYRYRLEADIFGPAGITAHIRYLGEPITILPLETHFYTGLQLQMLGSSSDGFENTNNLTAEQLNAITINHALPEGEYRLCISAFDENGDRLSPASEGCATFNIVYIDRPEIVLPVLDDYVFPVVNVSWIQDLSSVSPMQRSRLIYRLNIGDATIDEFYYYLDDIFEMNFSSLRQFETQATTYQFVNGVEFNFIEGHEYVVWVTAVDPEGELMFLDRGNSNVVFFTYGTEADDDEEEGGELYGCILPEIETTTCTDPRAEMYFPSHQDTLPFRQFPFILRFDPYCNDYQRLEYNIQLNELPAGNSIYNRSDDLNWPPGGPLQYMLDQGITVDAERARMFMMNDSWLTPSFERSKRYQAVAEASMSMRHGGTFTYSFSNDFVSGMPKPGLETPAREQAMPPGSIMFRWDNGALPWNAFPDVFHLVRMHGSHGSMEDATFYGDVHEKWVLQISRSEFFEESSLVSGLSEEVNGAHFESVEDLMSGIYLVNNQSKDITEEGTYYWRVVWLKNPDAVLLPSFYVADSDLYHSSEIRKFIIDNEAGESPGGPGEEEETEPTCSAPCVFPAITNTTPISDLPVGSTFTIAGFTVETRTVSGSGPSYNGEGYIRMPLLNNIKLRVQFTGLQINASRQAFAGRVTPVQDDALPFSDFISPLGRIVSMTQTEAEAMDAAIEGTGKLISLLTPGSETALPIGIDKEIEGSRIVIGIIDLMLKPDSARMTAVVNIDLPNMEIVDGFISLGADVCITPSGFANDVRLYLPQDQVFDLGNGNEFVIAGAENDRPTNQVTAVEWDCDGFRALNITGIHRFTRDWLLPEGTDGHILSTGKVEARFTGRFVRGGNIMINIDMDPFQLPGVEGWGFTVAHNAWIDLSDLENPERFMASLPADYEHPSLTSAGMQNTWKGFFLEEVSVRSPEHLQGPDGNRLSFALRNIFIDNTGLTFSARAENILSWEGDGDMVGWKASLDTFFVDILQNNFRQAGFNGKLGFPIAEETEFMKYQAALQHTDGDFAFVLSVRPVEAIRIPISMAQATILPSTYVRVVLADSSFIEANLSATLTIGNSNLPSGTSMPASMSMPGIRIENLRINSEIGFDTTDFAYSLTGLEGIGMGGSGGHGRAAMEDPYLFMTTGDSESTLSGFPIGLDHFSFSNEGITIQPRITLSGSEGGFSAAAKILLNTDMQLAPTQRFNLTGVTLQRIDLNVEASDVTLRGYLEFYKDATTEGVKGGITLGINMGQRIGIDINADFGTYKTATATVFNTRDWYSYFYVDGTVFLSSGIQIFSGLSLYGLGGGFYHHMEMTSGLPASTAVASGGSTGRPSGVRYRPNFSNDLGLKFKVILGSNGDEGKAYNLDVGLQAEFSFTHGLTLLRFEGSFRVMTDGISIATIGREGNSPVAGYLDMKLNLPPDAPATFNGQFFVKVKVPVSSPLLTGIGTIPNPPEGWTAENALVWAKFYVGPDKWFFHMGSPTNRGGLRLRIGDVDVARITGYMMIGHDIPVLMPEPDAEFVRIFNASRGGGVTSDLGDPATLTEGRPRPSVPLGEGVAFGIAMAMNLSAEFFPFYFDLSSVMGCDINITRATDGDRTCAGTGLVPGVDGWYGMGQFYAGIQGAFGIRINLFVEQITVPILQASAAIILRGGLPNPEWVAGRGSFYYNVCDGLAEGTCDFALQAGTVCIPVATGNPFGELTLLQDLRPGEGETVEVYADAAAAFAMGMNRVYEIEEYVSAIDPPAIRRLEPYMHSFEIKLNGRGASLPGTGEWSENNHIYTFYPTSLFQGESNYTARVEARIRENGRDLLVRGTAYREELLHHFRTGPMPDHIVPEMINFTYPYIRQQNFLKSETRADQGYIVLLQRNPLLSVEGDVSNVDVSFTARFTSEDRAVISTPAVIEREQIIKFDVRQLQPGKLYCLQIIRRDQPRGTVSLPGNMSMNSMTGGPVATTGGRGGSMQIQNLYAVLGRSTVTSNQFTRISLPAGQVRQNEKELFNYFFKTSGFTDFRTKLAAEQSDWDHETITFGVDVIKLENSFSENLEWVDVNTFKVLPHGRSRSFSKRVNFYLRPPLNAEFDTYTPGTVLPNQYFMGTIAPRIVVPYLEGANLRQRVINSVQVSWGVNVSSSIPGFPLYNGYPPYDQSIFFSEVTPFKNPLDDATVNMAFTETTGPGITMTGLSVPILPPGVLPMTPHRTTVLYSLHLTGMTQYRELQRDYRRFAYQTLTLPVGVGTITTSPYELMNATDKTSVTRLLSREPIGMTRPSKGPHSFGFVYKYPLPDGTDTYNEIIPFTFHN